MRIIEADINRDLHSETIFRCGSFEYRLNKDFLKMPENLRYTPIVTGCCDAEDNIYLATRDADHPIVKVDAEGRYIRDFGKGLFNFIHSFITKSVSYFISFIPSMTFYFNKLNIIKFISFTI